MAMAVAEVGLETAAWAVEGLAADAVVSREEGAEVEQAGRAAGAARGTAVVGRAVAMERAE